MSFVDVVIFSLDCVLLDSFSIIMTHRILHGASRLFVENDPMSLSVSILSFVSLVSCSACTHAFASSCCSVRLGSYMLATTTAA